MAADSTVTVLARETAEMFYAIMINDVDHYFIFILFNLFAVVVHVVVVVVVTTAAAATAVTFATFVIGSVFFFLSLF